MAERTLATKYRPRTFEDVVKQSSVITILKNQLETKTTKNVYLFVGPAGTGKTTIARIFARDINSGKGLPVEIDGASNNGVDNVREIISQASQRALESEYKVYIIDECHALSNAAWQAMLKTLEEPPSKTIFLFCTTDPQKLPNTILSRVQRYDFQRIPTNDIAKRLEFIIKEENKVKNEITYNQDALEYIAKISEGGMRDAITMLDKCLSLSNDITVESVVSTLGTVNYELLFRILNAIIDFKTDEVISIINEIHNSGADLKLFIKQLTYFILDVNKYAIFKNFNYIQIPQTFEENLKGVVNVDLKFLNDLLDKINNLNSTIKWESNVRSIIELELILQSK